jgi:hypothetical protein
VNSSFWGPKNVLGNSKSFAMQTIAARFGMICGFGRIAAVFKLQMAAVYFF